MQIDPIIVIIIYQARNYKTRLALLGSHLLDQEKTAKEIALGGILPKSGPLGHKNNSVMVLKSGHAWVGGIKPSQIALLLLNPLNASRLPPAKPHFFEFRNPLSTTTPFPRGICVDWPEKAGANDRRSSPTLPANEQATTARKRACLVPVSRAFKASTC